MSSVLLFVLATRYISCSEAEANVLSRYLVEDECFKNSITEKFSSLKRVDVYGDQSQKIVRAFTLRNRRDTSAFFIFITLLALVVLTSGLLAKYEVKPFDTFTKKEIDKMIVIGGAVGPLYPLYTFFRILEQKWLLRRQRIAEKAKKN